MKKYALVSVIFFLSGWISSCNTKTNPGSITPPLPGETKIYYVAASGDDTRTAAQEKNPATPWRTIQKASSGITGGDTVVIMGGTYSEQVIIGGNCTGTAAKPTLFKAKDGETVIIDGRVLNPDTNAPAGSNTNRFISQVKFVGASHITIRGIKVQNAQWYGISVEANADNTTIDGCKTFNTGASGIYVKESKNITIANNDVQKACQITTPGANNTGTQECITLAKVSNFVISKNEVSNSTIPGLAGGEGIDVKGGSFDGEISNNYVHDIVPLGIYVDAGSMDEYNIRVFNNRANNTGGFAVAGELGGHAHEIYFYNNVISNSKSSGFVFQSVGNGKFTNVYIVNNTFYNNALTGNFVGEIGNYSTNTGNANIVIRNNIIYNKGTNYKFSIWHNVASSHSISHNLYYDFKPSNNAANSFTAANLTASDIKDLNPLFVNAATVNFALQAASPAINKAVPVTLPGSAVLLFTTDFNGIARGAGNWDMGAFEF